MEDEPERQFEVLTAAVMQGINFWDITPCNQLKVSKL
jgi:aryl-alcohol dehydrogenase-like predicted oxidoreductase